MWSQRRLHAPKSNNGCQPLGSHELFSLARNTNKHQNTMIQLIIHLVGDYITQTDWMAKNKTKNSLAAGSHALIYSLPFLLLKPSWTAFAVILGTHFLIDRFRLARFVVYAKNWTTNPSLKWADASGTGYHKDDPAWLAVWLLIAADNTLHLAINYAALRWL